MSKPRPVLAQARLPDGVADDGKVHVPLAVEGDTFLQKAESLGAVLAELFITPRAGLVVLCGWALVFIFTRVLSGDKGPKRALWWNSKFVYKHIAPLPTIALCMWLVWQPGLRSHIHEQGFRYAQGVILGLVSFFTYPLLPFLMRSFIKHVRRVVRNFTK